MKTIVLGTDVEKDAPFTIPLTGAVTKTLGIFGKKGSGKTWTAAVWVEQLLVNKVPVVILDPVGRWWDLSVGADGQSPGFPIALIGGRRGQIPLTADMGPAIARYVVEKRVPTVVDLSTQSKATWRKVVADFCDELFMINEYPVHVILEEAPEFIPQRVFGELATVFGSVDRLVRLGRNNGIGITVIGQRLQTTNKDTVSQVDALFVMRLVDPHGRKSAREWVQAKGQEERADEFVDALTKLPTGTGYFWSPEWLEVFAPVRVAARTTYHYDADRVATERGPAAGQMARAVDAGELQRLFSGFMQQPEPKASTAATGKGKPAAAATRRIADLQREVESLRAALEAAQAQAIPESEIEERVQRAVEAATDEAVSRLAQAEGFLAQLVQQAQVLLGEVPAGHQVGAPAGGGRSTTPAAVREYVEKQMGFFPGRTTTNILRTLGDNFGRFADGMTAEEIATEVNYDPRGGRYLDALRLLTKRRVIVKSGDRYQLNPAHLK